MMFKVHTVYAFVLLACASHCTSILPLSHWHQPEAAAAAVMVEAPDTSSQRFHVARSLPDSEVREQGSAMPRAAEQALQNFAFENQESASQGSTNQGSVVNQAAENKSVELVAAPTPIDTNVQISDEQQRGARQMKPDPTTMKPRKSKNKESLMSRILPMLVMPFLISSSMIPMMLTSLKFMMLKSLLVGKIAIVLLVINALWKSDNRGGVYSHNVNYDLPAEQKDLHQNHYGYNGDEEYGAYVNRRSARVSRHR